MRFWNRRGLANKVWSRHTVLAKVRKDTKTQLRAVEAASWPPAMNERNLLEAHVSVTMSLIFVSRDMRHTVAVG